MSAHGQWFAPLRWTVMASCTQLPMNTCTTSRRDGVRRACTDLNLAGGRDAWHAIAVVLQYSGKATRDGSTLPWGRFRCFYPIIRAQTASTHVTPPDERPVTCFGFSGLWNQVPRPPSYPRLGRTQRRRDAVCHRWAPQFPAPGESCAVSAHNCTVAKSCSNPGNCGEALLGRPSRSLEDIVSRRRSASTIQRQPYL